MRMMISSLLYCCCCHFCFSVIVCSHMDQLGSNLSSMPLPPSSATHSSGPDFAQTTETQYSGVGAGAGARGLNYGDVQQQYRSSRDKHALNRNQAHQKQKGSSRHPNFMSPGDDGAFDEDQTFPQTKTKNSTHLQERNPKMNTILLYNNNNNTSGSKSNKKPSGANKTISNYLPKKVTSANSEKKRAASAGRLRGGKRGDSSSGSGAPLLRQEGGRHAALDHMFGDRVLEELDLAMQQQQTPPPPASQHHNHIHNHNDATPPAPAPMGGNNGSTRPRQHRIDQR
jgi:hypothetical protein